MPEDMSDVEHSQHISFAHISTVWLERVAPAESVQRPRHTDLPTCRQSSEDRSYSRNPRSAGETGLCVWLSGCRLSSAARSPSSP